MTPTRELARGAEQRPRSLGHIPSLDGLRGIALVGVLLFHAGLLRGGFLGVDLFFVLSGFLITSLLLAEWTSRQTIDLVRFWSRRLRRLLPAALVTLAAISTFAAVHLDGAALARFRGDALAALGDVANWRAIATGDDYWAAHAEPSLLRHMWSLSIEEQLYVLWPLILLAALHAGRARRRSLEVAIGAAAVLLAASVGALAVLGRHSVARAYFGTDTRASAVLLGALAALLLRRWSAARGPGSAPAWVGPAMPLAVVVLALGWALTDGQEGWLYTWGLPCFSLAAAVVVVWSATAAAGSLLVLLEWWPLRGLGVMSYGIYLIHWPVYVALDDDLGWSRWVLTTVRIGVSIALALLSLVVIERPVRLGRLRTRTWRALALGGIVALAGLIVVVTWGARDGQAGIADRPLTGPAGATSLLLLGDSQAATLSEGAEAVLDPVLRHAGVAALGCGIGPGLPTTNGVAVENDLDGESCTTAVDRFVDGIDRYDPDIVVLNVGAWEIFDRLIDGQVVRFGSTAWDDATRENLAVVLERLGVGDRRLVALAAPCFAAGDRSAVAIFGQAARDQEIVRLDRARVRHWNGLLREAATAAGAEVLPYDDLFCDAAPGLAPERADGVHLTVAGAEAAWRWILPRLHLASTADSTTAGSTAAGGT